MLTIILLGILTSVVAEIATALNKKLVGTVLQGDAAFLIVFLIALIGAIVKEATTPGFTWASLGDWHTLTATFSEVFAISQVYFFIVMKKLGLDVAPAPAVVTTTTSEIQASQPELPAGPAI